MNTGNGWLARELAALSFDALVRGETPTDAQISAMADELLVRMRGAQKGES